MSKNPLYKIFSAFAFLIIFATIIILFSKTNKINHELNIFYITILISALFLTIFNFWMIAKKTNFTSFFTEEQTKETKKITQNIDNEINEIKERENLQNTIFALLKDVDNMPNINKMSEKLLHNFADKFSIVQGIIFIKNKGEELFQPMSTYAYYSNETIRPFKSGEGISGQVAKNKKMLSITNIPEDYITVLSGLGSSSPSKLLIIPLIADENTNAIIELASFTDFPENIKEMIEEVSKPLGELIQNI